MIPGVIPNTSATPMQIDIGSLLLGGAIGAIIVLLVKRGDEDIVIAQR